MRRQNFNKTLCIEFKIVLYWSSADLMKSSIFHKEIQRVHHNFIIEKKVCYDSTSGKKNIKSSVKDVETTSKRLNKLVESLKLKATDKLISVTNQTINGTVLLTFIKTADQKSPFTLVPYLEKGPLQMFSVVMSLITSYLAKYCQLPLSVKNWKLNRKTDLPIWNTLVLHVESFESKNVQFIFCRAKFR